MKTTDLIIIIFMFVSLISISGCVGGEGDASDAVFVGGSNGLELSFVKGAPPEKIFQNQPFNIELFIENKGEADIRSGEVEFVLNNAGILGLTATQSNKEDLARRLKVEKDFIKGGYEYISWSDAVYTGSVSPFPISIEACYPYKTTGVADLCITQGRASEICEIVGARKTESSGAPLAVISVEQLPGTYISGSQEVIANVEIKFKNIGRGEIYSTLTDCTLKAAEQKDQAVIEQIRIGATRIYGNALEKACGSDRVLFDSDGMAYIRCNLPIQNIIGDYLERMTIEVSYLHTLTFNKQIPVIVTQTN